MAQRMVWDQLLCEKRPCKASKGTSGGDLGGRSEFEADYDRVVFSSAFRRLARKTQVHPLAPNDHIHNRLIHSIEVGSVGRSLGKKLQEFLQEYEGVDVTQGAYAYLPTIVQVGCLVHDIGNPPFGHAGEYAIREWIAEHKGLVFPDNHNISTEMQNDLLMFEGNAQGFRIASRTDVKSGYMRLTYAALGSMIKYPWVSSIVLGQEKPKYNIFDSEKHIFTEIANDMGLIYVGGKSLRHPLSFLTEAADDICYRMLDMEDAVLMKIFPEEPIVKLFCDIAEKKYTPGLAIGEARGSAIGKLIHMAWEVFKNDYDNIMIGSRSSDLKSSFYGHYVTRVDDIEEKYKEIFSHRSKLGFEIGSYKTLGRIIKAMVKSVQKLSEQKNYKKIPFISQRCLTLAWSQNFIEKNMHQDYSWWISHVFDYVSGLTDNYAIQVSNEIEGILK